MLHTAGSLPYHHPKFKGEYIKADYVQEEWVFTSCINRIHQKLLYASIADKTLNECCRCRSIDDVLKVISVDNREVVADEVIVKAVSHHFA